MPTSDDVAGRNVNRSRGHGAETSDRNEDEGKDLLRVEVEYFVRQVEKVAQDSITDWTRLVGKYEDTYCEEHIRSLLPRHVYPLLEAFSYVPDRPPLSPAAPVTVDARRYQDSSEEKEEQASWDSPDEINIETGEEEQASWDSSDEIDIETTRARMQRGRPRCDSYSNGAVSETRMSPRAPPWLTETPPSLLSPLNGQQDGQQQSHFSFDTDLSYSIDLQSPHLPCSVGRASLTDEEEEDSCQSLLDSIEDSNVTQRRAKRKAACADTTPHHATSSINNNNNNSNKRTKAAHDDVTAAAGEPSHYGSSEGPYHDHESPSTPSTLPLAGAQTTAVQASECDGSADVYTIDQDADAADDRPHFKYHQEPRLARLLGLSPAPAVSSTEQTLTSLEAPEAWVTDAVMDASLAILSISTGGLRVRHVNALWTKRALDEAMAMTKESSARAAEAGTGAKTDMETSGAPSQVEKPIQSSEKTRTSRRIRTWLFLGGDAQRPDDNSGPSRTAAHLEGSPAPSYFPHMSLVFIPVNLNVSHWILVIIRPACRLVELYDPLVSRSASLQTFAAQCLDALGLAHVLGWGPFRVLAGPVQQPNTSDCGIYVIATAFLITTGQSLPRELAGDVWRRVLARVLRTAMSLDHRGRYDACHPLEPPAGSKPAHDEPGKHTSGSTSPTPAPKPLLPLYDPAGALSGPISFPMPDYFQPQLPGQLLGNVHFPPPSPGTLVTSSCIDDTGRVLAATEAASQKAALRPSYDKQARLSIIADVLHVLQGLSGQSETALVRRQQQLATLPAKIERYRSARQTLIDGGILRSWSRKFTTTEASIASVREAAGGAGGDGRGGGLVTPDDPASAVVTARIELLQEQLAVLQHGFVLDADIDSGYGPSQHVPHSLYDSFSTGGDIKSGNGFVGSANTKTTPLSGLLRRLGLAAVPGAAASNELGSDGDGDDYDACDSSGGHGDDEPHAREGTNARARLILRIRYGLPQVDDMKDAVDAVRCVAGDLGRELEMLRS